MDLNKLKTQLNDNAEQVFEKLGLEYESLGDNIYSCCPIHDDSDNPRAFSYSKSKGIWKCWTRDCQQSHKNDIFGLIQGALSKNEGVEKTFSDALKWAYKFLDIKKSGYTKKATLVEPCEFTKLVKSIQPNKSSVREYAAIELPETCESAYFKSRGFKSETLKYFDVGDCNDKKSKLYERAIIPIHNDAGDSIIGCTARTIKEYRSPKFLLYPTGFDKRHFFYNYHRAIQYVNNTSSLFLVEGQSDVWKLYEAGIKQVMGIFGRSLSKEQEQKIHLMPVAHIVVLLDNDQSGREAKIQIQRQLNRMYKLYFPKIPTKDVGDMSIEQIKTILLPQIQGVKI